MKCPNCREDSRIRAKDNFCYRCGFNLKEYRKSAKRWPGATLDIDEEVQGSSEVVTDLNKFRSKVNKQLDERVTAIVIKKTRATQGDSCKGAI